MDLGEVRGLTGGAVRQADAACQQSAPDARAVLQPVTAIDTNLVAAWTDLAGTATEPNSFYEPWCLRPALDLFAHHPDLRLFLLWAGDPGQSRLLGLLPIGPEKRFGRWPVPHIQNWRHHNCFLATPLVRAGFEDIFWQQLLAALDGGHWPGFLHINGMTVGGALDQALRRVCAMEQRRCDLVRCEARALLEGPDSAEQYCRQNVRAKKRKELRRQSKRLDEAGDGQFCRHRDAEGLDGWIDEFLALERKGWKGANGSALDCADDTRGFFRAALQGAAAAGQLERRDLRLDGQPIAMLVNLLSGEGGFGFKTAFDEDFSRFSPGVLLQIENLESLDNPAIAWLDSCASEGHPMIDSLWIGRRHIGRYSVQLKGLSRGMLFRGLRFGEDMMAMIKGRKVIDPVKERP